MGACSSGTSASQRSLTVGVVAGCRHSWRAAEGRPANPGADGQLVEGAPGEAPAVELLDEVVEDEAVTDQPRQWARMIAETQRELGDGPAAAQHRHLLGDIPRDLKAAHCDQYDSRHCRPSSTASPATSPTPPRDPHRPVRPRVLFGLGSSVYDWKDPFGRLFLQTPAIVAEFEANLNHLRTREGMARARRQGRPRGKQPKLPPSATRTIRPLRRRRGVPGRARRGVQRRALHHPPHHPPARHRHPACVITCGRAAYLALGRSCFGSLGPTRVGLLKIMSTQGTV